jgi:hypothetical protein
VKGWKQQGKIDVGTDFGEAYEKGQCFGHMKAAGVEDARHYAAGMSGWRSRKGPVVV